MSVISLESEVAKEERMVRRIHITAGSVVAKAELNDTEAADAVWQVLPIKGLVNTWGDEIYFHIPVSPELGETYEVVELGDLGYWPPGSAFCIFFGRTPVSRGDEIRPASAVAILGKVVGDATVFKGVTSGTDVLVEAVQ
jgi:hypothetical protein